MRIFQWCSLGVAVLLVSGCSQSNSDVSTQLNCPAADENGRVEIVPGLTATIIKKGFGRAATKGDYADVHTTLWLYDENADDGRGQEIWTSGGVRPYQFELGVGQVISGWDMGVPCMLIGEKRELLVSSELGYGAAGKPPVPPNADLLFLIELVELEAKAQ